MLPSTPLTYPNASHSLTSRRLLLHTISIPPAVPTALSNAGDGQPTPNRSYQDNTVVGAFDVGVIIVLAVLVFSVILALVINTIIRCVFRAVNCCWPRHEPIGMVGPVINTQVGMVSSVINARVRSMASKAESILIYSDGLDLPLVGLDCAICLAKFESGEHLRVMPKCSHGFHVRCIDRWLLSQFVCPTCRQHIGSAGLDCCGTIGL